MKRFIPVIIIVLMYQNSFTQMWDTFESYSTQAAADAAWGYTGGNQRVNITNDVIDIAHTGGGTSHNISFDLQDVLGTGNFASETAWVLRFTTNYSDPPELWATPYFVLSDEDFNSPQCNSQNWVGSRHDGTRIRIGAGFGTALGENAGEFVISWSANTTYYWEVVRNGTNVTVNRYNAGYVTLLEGVGGTVGSLSNTLNLRYVKIAGRYDCDSGGGNYVGVVDDVQFCDGTAIFNCNPTPLPIDLLSFSAKWKDNSYETAIINWQTINEYNNDYFDIERSIDALNFTPIAQIEGTNNGITINNYEHLDESPYTDGVSYYRLKQVDNNGDVFYSNIDALNVPQGLEIVSIYPNPVVSNLNFHVLSSLDIEIQINIFNTLGQLIIEENQPVQKGLNTMSLNTEGINNGHYFMEITTNGGEYSVQEKFIVE